MGYNLPIVPTIVMFAVPHENCRDVYAIAVDADGKFVTGQICSHSGWALTDLSSDLRSHHAVKMDSRYPEGYTKVWCEFPPANWDGQKTQRPESTEARPLESNDIIIGANNTRTAAESQEMLKGPIGQLLGVDHLFAGELPDRE